MIIEDLIKMIADGPDGALCKIVQKEYSLKEIQVPAYSYTGAIIAVEPARVIDYDETQTYKIGRDETVGYLFDMSMFGWEVESWETNVNEDKSLMYTMTLFKGL